MRPLAPSRIALWSAIVLGLLAAATPARADRAFTPRYSTNETGDIAMAANTLLTCPASDARCGAAQRGASASNNSFRMGVVDVDGNAATFDSSRAELRLVATTRAGRAPARPNFTG